MKREKKVCNIERLSNEAAKSQHTFEIPKKNLKPVFRPKNKGEIGKLLRDKLLRNRNHVKGDVLAVRLFSGLNI